MSEPRPGSVRGRGADFPLLAALALLSAAITAHQLALMQVLGWMHWHHFAYLIVSVALLGYGVAGTVLSLARGRLLRHWRVRTQSIHIDLRRAVCSG